MLDTRTSSRIGGIAFAADLVAAQGFVALSWLTPLSWDLDVLVSLLIFFAVGIGSDAIDRANGFTDE